jgi:hypothetical protein
MPQEAYSDMNDTHARIYANLVTALGKGNDPKRWPSAWKLEKEPYQTLHIDVLERGSDFVTIALAHYFEQNGDMVPDPDMEIRLNLTTHTAVPMSFQNSLVYTRVEDENGQPNPKALASLTSFLASWVRNIAEQHGV